mmetsp:Transcript_54798/g.142668  ORF Transcript_54798/g.142668 Transcript_54798/m.142668 type:complete len:201 (+) Transcript_54798:346-948(+)
MLDPPSKLVRVGDHALPHTVAAENIAARFLYMLLELLLLQAQEWHPRDRRLRLPAREVPGPVLCAEGTLSCLPGPLQRRVEDRLQLRQQPLARGPDLLQLQQAGLRQRGVEAHGAELARGAGSPGEVPLVHVGRGFGVPHEEDHLLCARLSAARREAPLVILQLCLPGCQQAHLLGLWRMLHLATGHGGRGSYAQGRQAT